MPWTSLQCVNIDRHRITKLTKPNPQLPYSRLRGLTARWMVSMAGLSSYATFMLTHSRNAGWGVGDIPLHGRVGQPAEQGAAYIYLMCADSNVSPLLYMSLGSRIANCYRASFRLPQEALFTSTPDNTSPRKALHIKNKPLSQCIKYSQNTQCKQIIQMYRIPWPEDVAIGLIGYPVSQGHVDGVIFAFTYPDAVQVAY